MQRAEIEKELRHDALVLAGMTGTQNLHFNIRQEEIHKVLMRVVDFAAGLRQENEEQAAPVDVPLEVQINWDRWDRIVEARYGKMREPPLQFCPHAPGPVRISQLLDRHTGTHRALLGADSRCEAAICVQGDDTRTLSWELEAGGFFNHGSALRAVFPPPCSYLPTAPDACELPDPAPQEALPQVDRTSLKENDTITYAALVDMLKTARNQLPDINVCVQLPGGMVTGGVNLRRLQEEGGRLFWEPFSPLPSTPVFWTQLCKDVHADGTPIAYCQCLSCFRHFK